MFDLTTNQMLLVLIPAMPLLSAVVTAVLGAKLLKERSHLPTVVALAASLLLSLTLLLNVRQASQEAAGSGLIDSVGWETVVNLWTWAEVPDAYLANPQAGASDLRIDVTLRADALTVVMLSMVTFVSLLVAIYARGYMHSDRGYWRFFAYVSLFVFSMTMLVSVSNFLLLYVFWEAVGVCSYFLIGFWYEKPEAAAAGKKAFLVNRVGDFGFALALFLIWTTYGTLNFHDTSITGEPVAALSETQSEVVVQGVFGQQRLAEGNYVHGPVALAICLLLMLGACGKSAQFPLHVWLPDAMEGPTPVSALIHAATMVTAGVYMVARCTPLFVASEEAQLVVASIGGLTALMAGIIAFTQTDLKRVLAYSTISQLGYMFLALGTGSLTGITAGMFHLFTHAFFKALLFLGAGSVMHAMGGVIDMRRFGGLRKLMPITCFTFLFGSLALAGVIPFAGFWSKDAILVAVLERSHESQAFQWLYYGGILTAFLTAMYTFRAFFLTFFGEEVVPADAGHHAHESPASMTGPLCILAVCALVVGFFQTGFGTMLGTTPSLAYEAIPSPHADHHAHFQVAALSTVIALLGVALAAFLYLGDQKEVQWLTVFLKPIYLLSYGKFFFDPIYKALVVWPMMALAHLSYWMDRYLVDGLVNLTGKVPLCMGSLLRTMQTGLLQYYAMLMVLGLLVLIGTLFL